MKAVRTFFLILLVVGIGGYIFLVERHKMSSAERVEFEKQVFKVRADQVTGIQIRTAAYDVDLTLKNGQWFLRHPEGARAGDAMVKRTLSRLETLQRGELITPEDMRQREVSLADFGLYVPKTVLTLQTSSGSREYRVGDPNPLKSSVYIKEENSQNVMLVSSDLLDILPEQEEVFYDSSLFPYDLEQVDSLGLVRQGGTLRLNRTAEGWRFTEPKARPADATQTESLVAKLLKATAEGYLNDPDEGTDYGFDSVGSRFRMWSQGSSAAQELILGGDVIGEPGLIYAKLEGRGGLLKVSKGLQGLAQTPADGLRPATLMSPGSLGQVSRIEFIQGNENVTLELEGKTETSPGNWVMKFPLDRDVEDQRVSLLLETWGKARVVGFDQNLDGKDTSHRVRFLGQDGKVVSEWDLMLGENLPGRSLVKQVETGEGFRVTPDLTPLTSPDPLSYLPRSVLQINPREVVRVGLTYGEDQLEFLKATEGDTWSLDEKEVPEAFVAQLLTALVRLEAVRLMMLPPEEIESLGLEKPDVRLSLGLGGDKPANITLSIFPNTGKGVCRVAILGDELVYEVSSAQCEALRSLFDPFLEVEVPETPDEETPAVP